MDINIASGVILCQSPATPLYQYETLSSSHQDTRTLAFWECRSGADPAGLGTKNAREGLICAAQAPVDQRQREWLVCRYLRVLLFSDIDLLVGFNLRT